MPEFFSFKIIGFVRLCFYICLIIAPLLVSGCTSARLDEAAWQDQRLSAVWPQAPEKGRIRIQQVIRGPLDVTDASSSGVLKKVFEYVTGNKDEFIDIYTPQCIAADGNGLIYIADPSIGMVHKYNLASKEVQYIFQAGVKKLATPVGVALDGDNNLYITDTQHAAIFKYSSDGAFLKELDGKGNLRRPAGIAVNKNGDKLVADVLADKVYVFGRDDIFKGEFPATGFTESFNRPTYIAVDSLDNVYVTDTMNFTVRVFDAAGKYIRNQGQIGDVPGAFARPKGLALDSDRNLYVLDAIFGNFQIFDQSGQLLLYVGQEGTLPGEFMLPSGIFIDKNDRIYVSDTFNHRIQIYQYMKEKVAK
jgi:DNA-binding beta-propeller fold protein YncE